MLSDTRTLRVTEYYRKWYENNPHRDPPVVAEVEKMFKLSENYVYKILGDIAEAIGKSREDLLHAPHPNYERTKVREYQTIEPIDIVELDKASRAALDDLNRIQREVDGVLAKVEETKNIMAEEQIVEEEED